MTVYASKPEINVREKLKELDKPSGIAGEAMLRAETPQEQFNLIGAGRKNLIINGDYRIQQRGSLSTATGAENNIYYVDRWRIRNARTSSDMTTQIVTDDLPPHMSQGNAYKVTALNNYSSTQHLGFVQVIEDTQQLAGETVTYSAWIKSNTKVELWIYEIDSAFGNASYESEPHPGDGNWHKVSITATFRGHVNDQIILYVTNYGHSATGGAYHISTQHQLEFNNISTPFEYRSYGEELALCQRYYQVLNTGRIGGVINGSGQGIVTNQMVRPYMRGDPDITINGTIGFYYMSGTTQVGTSVTGAQNLIGYGLNLYKADGNTGDGNSFWCDFTSSAYLAFDAEF